MSSMDKHKWITWASSLSAIAQSGLHFSKDPFDIERYHLIKQLAAEILAEHSHVCGEKILELFNL